MGGKGVRRGASIESAQAASVKSTRSQLHHVGVDAAFGRAVRGGQRRRLEPGAGYGEMGMIALVVGVGIGYLSL